MSHQRDILQDQVFDLSVQSAIRVLIVDDHPVVRAGLASMLSTRPEVEVAGTAANGDAALRSLRSDEVDVVLLDLRMARMGGIELLRDMRRLAFAARAIILTSFVTDEEIYQAIQAGAWGYLTKETGLDLMMEAITAVHSGRRFVRGEIAERLVARMSRGDLTQREFEVLKLVAKGLTNKEIGESLRISSLTVKNHVNSILVKLEVSDRTEASTVAISLGLIEA